MFGRADAEEASRSWWIFLFAGIASIVFGVLILTVDWSLEQPGDLRRSALHPPGSVARRARRRSTGAGAGRTSAPGCRDRRRCRLIAWPDKGLQTVGVFIGIFVLSLGLLHIVGAISNRHVPNWWHMLVLGLLEVPIGVWAMRRPGQTIVLLVTLDGRVGRRQRDLPGPDRVRAQEASAAPRLGRGPTRRSGTSCPASDRRTSRR